MPGSYPAGYTCRMNPSLPTNLYKRHRFPAEMLSHGVWRYCRFCLSEVSADRLYGFERFMALGQCW
jgi:hypothetical protein